MAAMPPRHTHKGFSLVEAALVIGIVGLIVGGTAIAMSAVRQAQQTELLMQQVYSFIENYRNSLATQAMPTCVASETTASTYTTTLRQRSVFPESMCSSSCVAAGSATVRNAFGGAVLVNAALNGSNCERIQINLTQIGKKGCSRVLTELGDRFRQVGLVATQVNGGATRTTSSFPLSISTIASDCGSTDTNTINLFFGIRS